MGDGNDIIIKGGGSVSVTFDSDAWEKDENDGKVHHHKDKNITRVRVSDGRGNLLYDSEPNDATEYEVRVTTKP
jgi:hypothetical protein